MAAAAPEPRWPRALAGLLAVLMLVFSPWAAAHPMPESRIWVDSTAQGLRLTLQLPLSRLELAYGQPLSDRPGQVLAQHGEALSRYLLLHVGARGAPDGSAGWQVLRPQLAVKGNDAAAELEAVLELRAPPGQDPRRFTLLYDAITHEVRTHRVQVLLRQDWTGGFVGEAPRLLGEIDSLHNTLPVALQPAQAGESLRSLFVQGARHIAEGTDHLLFLLTLLLAAPLAASGRRWGAARPASEAWKRLVAVVTAFTVGHTLTLALGSTGLLTPPAAWVEAAVALSIAVAAAHAARPLLRGGEVWMAGGFGLLHGLAFAASLSGGGLSAGQHAQALLAFNLGIEAVQMAVVACAMPPLLLLARHAPQAYARLRVVAAVFAAAAAAAWLAQGWWPDTVALSAWIEPAAQAAPAVALVLWLIALAARWRASRALKG